MRSFDRVGKHFMIPRECKRLAEVDFPIAEVFDAYDAGGTDPLRLCIHGGWGCLAESATSQALRTSWGKTVLPLWERQDDQ